MASAISTSEIEDGIFKVTIDDPLTRNGLNDDNVSTLLDALAELADDTRVRVLILTGRKDMFCSGATAEMLEQLKTSKFKIKDLAIPSSLVKFPVPIIAAMQGHALGGGLAIALCCDLIVASNTGRYGMTFTNMGFTPGMGTTELLPSSIGYHLAAEMLLTGKLYTGNELLGMRLCNKVVESDMVLECAIGLARFIAEKPRYVLELLKQTLATSRSRLLETALLQEQIMHDVCFGQSDFEAHFSRGFHG